MSYIFWCVLLFRKYACLFSLKSIMLGIALLGCRFSIRLLISRHTIRWYGLIFFLVYVGGLLVLFIYISSLNFKPVFFFSKIKSWVRFFVKGNLIFLVCLVGTNLDWNYFLFSWSDLDQNNFSLNLFNESELFFLVNVGVLLLLVLWIITKLTFRRRGALRPVF